MSVEGSIQDIEIFNIQSILDDDVAGEVKVVFFFVSHVSKVYPLSQSYFSIFFCTAAFSLSA